MTSVKLLPASLALVLATLGFVGFQPEAEATCDVNVGGYCAGDCDVNALATCEWTGDCTLNAVATCGGWDGFGYASCAVNAALASCQGQCFANVADAWCGAWASCFANAGSADCTGWCAANVGLASCNGGCLVNAASSTCDSTACILGTGGGVEPICFLWGCTVNAGLAYCGEGGECLVNAAATCYGACLVNAGLSTCGPWATCAVNVASECYGSCFVNLASASLFVTPLLPTNWACGSAGSCTVNAAGRCDGACQYNVLATCAQTGRCDLNVVATCANAPVPLP